MFNEQNFPRSYPFEMVAVFDKETGTNVRFGTAEIVGTILDTEDAIFVPAGTDIWHKRVDLKTKTLVDIDQDKIDALTNATKWNLIRQQRDALLGATDYLIMADYPISDEKRTKVHAYRQALRDITKTANPDDVVWPPGWNA